MSRAARCPRSRPFLRRGEVDGSRRRTHARVAITTPVSKERSIHNGRQSAYVEHYWSVCYLQLDCLVVMGTKRRADDDGGGHGEARDPPSVVKLRRIDGATERPSGKLAGPFAVHFPSGYIPSGEEGQCNWMLYGREANTSQQAVVARTVSGCAA